MALKQWHERYEVVTSSRNSNNDTGTFRNSDISSFEIQTEDMDNPAYRALVVTWLMAEICPWRSTYMHFWCAQLPYLYVEIYYHPSAWNTLIVIVTYLQYHLYHSCTYTSFRVQERPWSFFSRVFVYCSVSSFKALISLSSWEFSSMIWAVCNAISMSPAFWRTAAVLLKRSVFVLAFFLPLCTRWLWWCRWL